MADANFAQRSSERKQSGAASAGMPPDGRSLYERAKSLIPGGTQLLSKRPEMFAPGQWPAYYREARGCEIVDIEGRRWLDMSIMGIGSCLLGYNDPDVTDAVTRCVQAGSMSTLNAPQEVELAERLMLMHPWAQQVRYARGGGEAMAVAVRIARAATNRSVIAFCGYHGWHDWYLAANLADADHLEGHLLPGLSPTGIPRQLAHTAVPFQYNQLDRLELLVSQLGEQLAAVVMEPTRSVDPEEGFLEGVRALCDKCGAVLVFDEITSGFRLHFGGVHLKYGVAPDIAVFAKALSNGHPMAAVIGTRAVMSAADRSFISSTYWTEAVGPTAALATIEKMSQLDVPAHLERIGDALRRGLTDLAARHGLPLKLLGHAAITSMAFDHPKNAAIGTLFTTRMMEQGILAGSGFYGTFAHQEEHVARYLEAAEAIYPELAAAIEADDIESRIGGPVRSSGFARLT